VADRSHGSTRRRLVLGLVVVLALVAGVRKISSSSGFKTSLESTDSTNAKDAWMQRSDVQQYMKEKVVFSSVPEDDVHVLFKKFQGDHHRTYESEDEEANRFEMFKVNLKEIDTLNRQNPIALFGITDAGDKTADERANRKMSSKWSNYAQMKESLPTEMVEAAKNGPEAVTGKTFSSKIAQTVKVAASEDKFEVGQFAWATEDDCAACDMFPYLSAYNLDNSPENFDWRDMGAVTGVKNQKNCGSCWTFSTAQDVEGTHFLATGNLTSFSEQQLVACDIKNDGCDGGFMYEAMQYLANFGTMVSAEAYPYKGVSMDYDEPTPTCDTDLLNSKRESYGDDIAHVSGFQMVAMGEGYEELMKVYLTKNGPLALAINANGMDYYIHGITGCETIAGSEFCEAGSIDDHTPCDPESLDHGVLAVGYGVQEGTEYWVIKNSWAETWGEEGYYRTLRGTDHCGVANMVQHTVVKSA